MRRPYSPSSPIRPVPHTLGLRVGLGVSAAVTLALRGTVTPACPELRRDFALGFLLSETENLQLKTDNFPVCLGLAFLSLSLPAVFLLLADGYRLIALGSLSEPSLLSSCCRLSTVGCRLLPNFPLDIPAEFPPNSGKPLRRRHVAI